MRTVAGGDLVEDDRSPVENRSRRSRSRRVGGVRRALSGLCLTDVGVEAFQEAAISVGFTAPAAGFGVACEGFGVGALCEEAGQVAGVGAETGQYSQMLA